MTLAVLIHPLLGIAVRCWPGGRGRNRESTDFGRSFKVIMTGFVVAFTHPTWEMYAFALMFPVLFIVMPFARREDWIGRVSFLILEACAAFLWVLLLRGIAIQIVRWWRERGRSHPSDGRDDEGQDP